MQLYSGQKLRYVHWYWINDKSIVSRTRKHWFYATRIPTCPKNSFFSKLTRPRDGGQRICSTFRWEPRWATEHSETRTAPHGVRVRADGRRLRKKMFEGHFIFRDAESRLRTWLSLAYTLYWDASVLVSVVAYEIARRWTLIHSQRTILQCTVVRFGSNPSRTRST